MSWQARTYGQQKPGMGSKPQAAALHAIYQEPSPLKSPQPPHLAVLVSFCYSDKYHNKKQLRKKGYFWLSLPDHGPSLRKVKGGTHAGA